MKIYSADLVSRLARGEPIAVAIDTSLVIRQRFQFDRGLLSVLGQFAATNIQILIVDVVLREIRSHHLDAVEGAALQLRRAVKSSQDLGLLDKASSDALDSVEGMDLTDFSSSVVEDYLQSIGAEILESSTLVDLAQVQDMYFERRPPFEDKKKHEFPDAFALNALERWSETNSTDVLLLSEDKGWITYSETSARLHHGVEVAEALAATQEADPVFLAALAASLRASTGELKELIADDVARLSVEADGNGSWPVDLTVTSVSLQDVSLEYLRDGDLEIVSREAGECVVQCMLHCVIGVDASITVHLFDRFDRTSMRVSGGSMHAAKRVNLNCLIKLVSPSRSEAFRVEAADLIDRDLQVDVGEVQVDFSLD